MSSESISYSDTNYFSNLIIDYLSQKAELKEFYKRFPSIESFEGQINEKKESFSLAHRETLVKSLKDQYKNFAASQKTLQNIEVLSDAKTFTITTGHQLNLFTGPLYFLFKIVSTINLASKLTNEYPDYNFVPIYWMATEDHDFEEINFFNFNGKKFKWNTTEGNPGLDAVGNLSTSGLDDVFKLFSAEIGGGKDAEYLKDIFNKAYLDHDNLTDATRYLANELFKDYGLVIIDGQDKALKGEFIPFVKKELLEQTSFNTTERTAKALAEIGYNVQVNPREINLFYLANNVRERIILKDETYFVNNTPLSFSQLEILQELQDHPERFSPNVMMRPLYQEVILPNLCYIGGGGELAYWFELKDYFEAVGVPFPILLLRNSALIQSEKQEEKRKKLKISTAELFLKQHELINRKVRQISNIDIDLSTQREYLKKQFEYLYELAEQTDKSFIGAVKAQEVKQLSGLNNLEKRLLKAQKRKLKDEVTRIAQLQNELFPNRSLQERQTNFSEIYMQFGEQLIPTLVEELDPLDSNFKILSFGK